MTPSFHPSHKADAREATALVIRAKTGDEAVRNALMRGFWRYADEVARFHARRKNVDEDQAAVTRSS